MGVFYVLFRWNFSEYLFCDEGLSFQCIFSFAASWLFCFSRFSPCPCSTIIKPIMSRLGFAFVLNYHLLVWSTNWSHVVRVWFVCTIYIFLHDSCNKNASSFNVLCIVVVVLLYRSFRRGFPRLFLNGLTNKGVLKKLLYVSTKITPPPPPPPPPSKNTPPPPPPPPPSSLDFQ